MTRRTRMLLLAAAALVAAGVGWVLSSPSPSGESPGLAVVMQRPPPRVTDPPDAIVSVGPDDDLARLAIDHPEGTVFTLAPGVYRQSGIIPRHHQEFRGAPGVVFNGSRVLPPEAFTRDASGHWWIGDQAQEGLAVGEVVPGSERDRHPEELFVDGARRLQHVGSRDALVEGAWFFDYDRDRIYLHDDPAAFDLVETSVGEFAFGGLAVRGVVISDIVVEKYASPHYYGALGGAEETYPTYDWTYRNVTARYNHGAGLAVGPGTVVEGSRFHHNGQIGIVGEGESHVDGYAARVVVRDSEIDHNLQLGFRWQHEGGGTKFKRMTAGMDFIDNWVHDNAGPGAWWDIDNRRVQVRGNLVEGNGDAGIYYEISYGPAVIADNVAIDNGGAGVQIYTARDVLVEDNLLWGNGHGLLALHDQNQIGEDFPDGLGDVSFSDNEVWLSGGASGVDVFGGDDGIYEDVRFSGNRYHVTETHTPWFRFGGADLTIEEWLQAFPTDGPSGPAPQPPAEEAEAIRLRFSGGP